MLKKLFDTTPGDPGILCQRPEPALLAAIEEHNAYISRWEKRSKRAGIVFVVLMAALWIGGDLAGFPSELVLVFGLLMLFGYPLIWALCALWISRPSMKRRSEELSGTAMQQMQIPDDAVSLEFLYPLKELQPDSKKDAAFESRPHLVYADPEALYIADLTGVARLPHAAMTPWSEAPHRAKLRSTIQLYPASDLKKMGIIRRRSVLSHLPVIGLFIPDTYLIPYQYSVAHTVHGDYLLCVPAYEMEQLHAVITGHTFSART